MAAGNHYDGRAKPFCRHETAMNAPHTARSQPALLVEIFADGACSGNPGPGGWGTILRSGGHEKALSGYDPATTNNRMELTAAIAGLAALKRPCRRGAEPAVSHASSTLTDAVRFIKRGMPASRAAT